jgi:hypothetical protein
VIPDFDDWIEGHGNNGCDHLWSEEADTGELDEDATEEEDVVFAAPPALLLLLQRTLLMVVVGGGEAEDKEATGCIIRGDDSRWKAWWGWLPTHSEETDEGEHWRTLTEKKRVLRMNFFQHDHTAAGLLNVFKSLGNLCNQRTKLKSISDDHNESVWAIEKTATLISIVWLVRFQQEPEQVSVQLNKGN